jgi:hypothetical protein
MAIESDNYYTSQVWSFTCIIGHQSVHLVTHIFVGISLRWHAGTCVLLSSLPYHLLLCCDFPHDYYYHYHYHHRHLSIGRAQQQLSATNMHSLPIRGSRPTDTTSLKSLFTSYRGMSLAADKTKHNTSLSSILTNHEYNHDNASAANLSAQSPPPLSSDLTETQSEDHMEWSPPSPVLSAPNLSDTSSGSDSDTLTPTRNHLKLTDLLPLPTSSPGCLTHAHQQAMANRITYDRLLPGGAFDPALYTPVFLHDTLMLPGSLATVLGKVRHHQDLSLKAFFPRTHSKTCHRTPPSISSTA